ncbi:MAG TPA: replication-relaxation family protein [Symbiobacteriaceae bacterium]|nr:replication-relaxation family protein [Symbiobacteriaceae bacterium]
MGKPAYPQTTDEVANALFTTSVGPGWDLLTWLAQVRYLTAELVALRFYPTARGVRSAAHRLTQLTEWRVGGEPLMAIRPARTRRPIYYLTEAGARLVSDYLQQPIRAFWHDALGRVSEGIVQHYLAVTEFEVALRWHAARSAGEVHNWYREPVIETEAGELRPDAGFTYSQGGRTWCYAVEIDRATEAPAKFAGKLPKYASLHKAARYRVYWEDLPDCLVIAVAGGMTRAQRLMAEINRLPRGPDEYRRFRYVAAEEIYYLPPSVGGQLPQVATGFELAACLVTNKQGEIVRRAVFG